MEISFVSKNDSGDGVDFNLGVCGNLDKDFIRDTINSYINKNKLSKRHFCSEYNLGYSSLLRFLKGGYSSNYNHICMRIIEEQECEINKDKYDLYLNNYEIELIKLLCFFIKDNIGKNTIVIGGTNWINNDIIQYLKKNDINIEIERVDNGRGDHDPYIVLKINSYSNNKIDYVLDKLQ